MISSSVSMPALGSISPTTKGARAGWVNRSEEHTSELQSLMRISYAVFCLKKKKHTTIRRSETISNIQQTFCRRLMNGQDHQTSTVICGVIIRLCQKEVGRR